jgi:RHH-type rel operon transcriptional repressor/antitoxin RelB
MLAINLPPDIDARLSELAEKTGTSREHVVREAILTYLDDLEDALIAIERLKSSGESIPLERLLQEYKLEQVD